MSNTTMAFQNVYLSIDILDEATANIHLENAECYLGINK